MRSLLLLLLLAASVVGIAGRGSAPIVLNVTHARSTSSNPMKFNNLTLWCSPDNVQVTINAANFVKRINGKRIPATVSANKKNATLFINEPTVEDAGEYTCEMETYQGKLSHYTHIYLRPVVISDETFTHPEKDVFALTAPALLVTEDTEVKLDCPAVGHPSLKFKWSKDGKPLEMGSDVNLDGSSVKFNKIGYDNAGIYSCETVNEYPEGKRKVKTLLSIQRDLRVKSPYSWIYPLALIVLIFILLFITILFCEMRKKRLDRKTLYTATE